MGNFADAIATTGPLTALTTAIIRREGGDAITNRPSDAGGWTRWGITAKTLGEWRRLGRLATETEIRGLTEDEARHIFQTVFFTQPGFGQLTTSDVIRGFLYDTSVLTGPRQAVLLLQRALDVTPDGHLGPATIAATALTNAPALLAHLITQRIDFQLSLILHEPGVRAYMEKTPTTNLWNARGWTLRALSFQQPA